MARLPYIPPRAPTPNEVEVAEVLAAGRRARSQQARERAEQREREAQNRALEGQRAELARLEQDEAASRWVRRHIDAGDQ